MFPGVVGRRRRRSSLRGSGDGEAGAGGSSYSGFVKGKHADGGDVVEDGEEEDKGDAVDTDGQMQVRT